MKVFLTCFLAVSPFIWEYRTSNSTNPANISINLEIIDTAENEHDPNHSVAKYPGEQGSKGYVNAHGVNIFYQTFGEGHPLLIINGGPGMSSEGFIPLAKGLSNNHTTILFDQRGTGKSIIENPSNENVTMDLMVADMEALRDHLGLATWVVMGHSFGGMLASYYTTKHPDRVAALILSSSGGVDMALFEYLNINSRLTREQQDSLIYWNKRIEGGDDSYQALLGRGRALAPAYLYDKSHAPVISERLTQGNWDINGLVFANMQAIKFDCKESLKSFNNPTLIIQGKQDIVDLSTANLAKEVLPQSKLVLLDLCGHYGWLEQREEYFRTLEQFLKSNTG